MARRPPPDYDTEAFEGAHQARGLSPSAKKFLEQKGVLRKKPQASAGSGKEKKEGEGKASKATRKRAAPAASASGDETSAQMPRRSRRARSLKGRHFRIPLDIDAKLQDLVEFYDGTMVWVICKLIQEEWVRSRRALRREPAGDEAPGSGGSDEPGE